MFLRYTQQYNKITIHRLLGEYVVTPELALRPLYVRLRNTQTSISNHTIAGMCGQYATKDILTMDVGSINFLGEETKLTVRSAVRGSTSRPAAI